MKVEETVVVGLIGSLDGIVDPDGVVAEPFPDLPPGAHGHEVNGQRGVRRGEGKRGSGEAREVRRRERQESEQRQLHEANTPQYLPASPLPPLPASQLHISIIERRAIDAVEHLVQGEVFFQRGNLGVSRDPGLEVRPFGAIGRGERVLPSHRASG